MASLLWAGTVVVLPTGTTCPSGDAIAAEIDRLGVVAALAALGSPEVTVKDASMHVVLRGRDNSMLGARDVAAPEACHERATVAAVFIAAWVGEWTTAPLAEAQDSRLEAQNHSAATLPSDVPRPRPRTANSERRRKRTTLRHRTRSQLRPLQRRQLRRPYCRTRRRPRPRQRRQHLRQQSRPRNRSQTHAARSLAWDSARTTETRAPLARVFSWATGQPAL